MSQLLAEIVSITKTTRSRMSQTLSSSPPGLRVDGLCLYGGEAGEDYARSCFEELKEALRRAAKSPSDTLDTPLPRGGDAAYASMKRVFEELLEGFQVTVGKQHLRVEWGHHC